MCHQSDHRVYNRNLQSVNSLKQPIGQGRERIEHYRGRSPQHHGCRNIGSGRSSREQHNKDRLCQHGKSHGTGECDNHNESNCRRNLAFHSLHILLHKACCQSRNRRCRHSGCNCNRNINEKLVFSGKNAPPYINLMFRISLEQCHILKNSLINNSADIVNGRTQKYRNDRNNQKLKGIPERTDIGTSLPPHTFFEHTHINGVYKNHEKKSEYRTGCGSQGSTSSTVSRTIMLTVTQHSANPRSVSKKNIGRPHTGNGIGNLLDNL